MSEEGLSKQLYEEANTGLDFEEWERHPATKVLLEHLLEGANKAKSLCLEIDPLEDPRGLLTAQYEVRLFTRLDSIIKSFINRGHNATIELEHLQGEHHD